MANVEERMVDLALADAFEEQREENRAAVERSARLRDRDLDVQASLGRLAEKLAAVRASGGPRRQPVSRRQRSRRPGWVIEAIVQVLADRREPMHVSDIHAAVEALVGEPVPPPSVKGALAKNVAGSPARFVRMARGRYILAAIR
jgi:hypothetical protein